MAAIRSGMWQLSPRLGSCVRRTAIRLGLTGGTDVCEVLAPLGTLAASAHLAKYSDGMQSVKSQT